MKIRKLIGTIAIIIVLYLGFFGSEEHNIKPFIRNWLNSKESAEVKNNVRKIGEDILDKSKKITKELTDSTINQIKKETL